ncbi:MAG: M15 family metallopeptidase [Bryobacteraceae bacterium]|nr:M15 family metallopeptidase [Bryobacteraceae bacterium]
MPTPLVFPARPGFAPLDTAARAAAFGTFSFVPAPTQTDREAIRIVDNWERENIVRVQIPQLIGIAGLHTNGFARFHKRAAPQLLALWKAWGDAGLLGRVLSWAGAYDARFIRGSQTVLSNHSFGTAFDINAPENPLNRPTAAAGQRGCVWELVAIAHAHGFFWGGHFTRLDGMHFEIAVPK